VTSLTTARWARAAIGEDKTSYSYPNPVDAGRRRRSVFNNQPEPVRRVLTFSTAPLEHIWNRRTDQVVLHASSSAGRHGLLRQAVGADAAIGRGPRQGLNPASYWITNGLAARLDRALIRRIDRHGALSHPYRSQPIELEKIYRLDISIEPMAHRFKDGTASGSKSSTGDSR